jgi:hypothetical protein
MDQSHEAPQQLPTIVHYVGAQSVEIILPKAFYFLVLFILSLAISYIHRGYKAYLALGPGGTPSTFCGFLKVSLLGLFALRHPRIPAPVPSSSYYPNGYLPFSSNLPKSACLPKVACLPKKLGCRPSVSGIAPHRQINHQGPPSVYKALANAIESLSQKHSSRLRLGTSCFEKHSTGLFSLEVVNRTCNGEICHAHPSDGSLHMTLHPADAKTVLETGWGERHPLAKGGWWTRFVPCGFIMVYAPRDKAELAVVVEIIKTAAWFVNGKSLDDDSTEGPKTAILPNEVCSTSTCL